MAQFLTQPKYNTHHDTADRLHADLMLAPLDSNGAPDFEAATLETLTWAPETLTPADEARLAYLVDDLNVVRPKSDGITANTRMMMWFADGAHHFRQLDGPARCFEQAVEVIQRRLDGRPDRERTPPPAANDNTPKPFRLTDWTASHFAGEPGPVEYLVDGVVPLGIPGMIAAMGEVGKSFTLLELHRRIAFGTSPLAPPILGGNVVQEGTAVFLTGEDDVTAMHRRIAAIDEKGARHAEKGDKLIVVPLPSVPGGIKPYWRYDRKNGLVETDEWRRLCDQLTAIPDLKSVAIDPLQLFAAVPLNEDPAAGQFVCASIASLAAQTGANVWFAHHMRKGSREIETLADARDSIRGTTALVDGVRVAYGMWYPPADKARRISRALGTLYQPNRVVLGGVVKANGAARRVISTYARNDAGLLVDRTSALGSAVPDQGDLQEALCVAVQAAAEAGQPFTKTGANGLYEQRTRLPEELREISKHRLSGLADDALSNGRIVTALASGSTTVKWLDVPDGPFARGEGEFRAGAHA